MKTNKIMKKELLPLSKREIRTIVTDKINRIENNLEEVKKMVYYMVNKTNDKNE